MAYKLATYAVVLVCLVAVGLAWTRPSVADFDLMSAVGVWHMNEGEGDEALDSSPSGNHGKLWREPAWVDGRFGQALEFDGQSFVWVKGAVDLPEGTSPRTLMCHFKWAEVNDFADAVRWISDAEVLLCLGTNNWRAWTSLQICAEGGPGMDTAHDRQMFAWDADTEWHHIAGVFPDGATTSGEFVFYLDGVRQEDTFMAEGVNGIDTEGGEAAIGCWTVGPISFFKGIIDDAAVFPFAMPGEDIANIAKRGLLRGQTQDVSPSGKLATSWGALRER